MDINTFFGGRIETSDDWEILVNKLGGPGAFVHIIPFDIKTLRASYAKDIHFNDRLTPLTRWDAATGISVRNGHLGPAKPVVIGGPLWKLLDKYHITSLAMSQAVCLLKAAARMLVTENAV